MRSRTENILVGCGIKIHSFRNATTIAITWDSLNAACPSETNRFHEEIQYFEDIKFEQPNAIQRFSKLYTRNINFYLIETDYYPNSVQR